MKSATVFLTLAAPVAAVGFAIAQRLVASGGRASLWDKDPAALERARSKLGAGTDTRVVDVTSVQDVDAAAARTANEARGAAC